MRNYSAKIVVCVLLSLCGGLCFAAEQAAAVPVAGMGVMVGEVTPTSALVQVRLCQSDRLIEGDLPGAAGVVEFRLAAADAASAAAPISELRAKATPSRDFLARVCFTDLQPGTRYVCTTRIGTDESALREGPVASFKTLQGAKTAAPAKFVVVTGMNYAKFHGDKRIDRALHLKENNTELPADYVGSDKELGYPSLASILACQPDFFIGTGDNVYYDTPKKPRAKSLVELRRKWHEQFVQPRYRDLFAAVPTYWEIDDHDFRLNDCDNTGDYEPTPEVGKRMMLEQLPYGPADAADVKTYRTHRVNRDLQIWLPENRWYRSPNASPDGPEKTIWGPEQKAWLKRTLQGSDATFKLLISPTPMVGPDDAYKKDNHTNHGGFRHERDEFFAWLKETGIDQQGFAVVCGDRHWQYHAVDSTGIEEFSCGALVDANSRLGRNPGDPKSTDPEATIRQPYSQNPRSGGFLLIEVASKPQAKQATLTFRYHDEHGKVLYEHQKTRDVK